MSISGAVAHCVAAFPAAPSARGSMSVQMVTVPLIWLMLSNAGCIGTLEEKQETRRQQVLYERWYFKGNTVRCWSAQPYPRRGCFWRLEDIIVALFAIGWVRIWSFSGQLNKVHYYSLTADKTSGCLAKVLLISHKAYIGILEVRVLYYHTSSAEILISWHQVADLN